MNMATMKLVGTPTTFYLCSRNMNNKAEIELNVNLLLVTFFITNIY